MKSSKALLSLKSIAFAIFLFISFSSFSQNWSALAGGTNGYVYAQTIYNGDLIVGGNFTSAGGVSTNYIAKWNGTKWDSLGTGMDGEVDALVVYNGDLIAGGHFTTAGGVSVNYIAVWNGTAWNEISGGMDNIVSALTIYKGDLIVGGYFTMADNINAKYIAKWDANNWAALDSGMSGSQAQVLALGVYDSSLVATGFFTKAGNVTANHVAKWNGTAWSALGAGFNNVGYSLTNYSGKLIAGGFFSTAGSATVNSIAQWDGSNWSALGSGMTATNYNYVLGLTVYKNNLIAGGLYQTAGGITTNGISKWNGSSWAAMDGGVSNGGSTAGVYTAIVYNNKLVVGGIFSSAGSVSASNIAQYDSVSCNFQPNINGNANVCSNEVAMFNATVHGSNTYKWRATNGNIISGQKSDTLYIKWNANGTDSLWLIESSSLCSDSILIMINISQAPQANVGTAGTICPGDTITIGAGAVNNNTYIWTSIPIGFTSFNSEIDVTPIVTTTYYLTETAAGGCSKTDSITIIVSPLPNANFTVTKTSQLTYQFDAADQNLASYLWNFGDSNVATGFSETHTYNKIGAYNISLRTESNSGGCFAKHDTTLNILAAIDNAPFNNNTIKVYPNPSSNQINLIPSFTLVNANMKIVNMLGQTMIQKSNMSGENFTFDLSDFATGLYILEINQNNKVYQVKISIK